MRKTAIKISVFIVVFLITLFAAGRIMNTGHNNLTMELAPATLPVVYMEHEGVAYNELHGYKKAVDTAFQRDTVTVLEENRSTGFSVDTYGREVTGIAIEVRSTDGSRLIENTPVTDFTREGERLSGKLALKDLIEQNTEYSLALVLTLDGEEEIWYYTRAVWSDGTYLGEKLAFVADFHQRLYDKEAAKELTRYLETDAALEDNQSFHKVNIHSSFQQITWGELPVEEITKPVFSLKEIASQTAAVLVNFMVSTAEGQDRAYYQVEEYYRVRYTSDRMYLLDYERTMTQIPDPEEMYANDKILLGIASQELPMMESEDGNIVVFEAADRLLSYNATANSISVIFSFYDKDNGDARTLYGAHSIKILDVDEGGNVAFAVYGYMNRGRHEGETGIQIYNYSSSLNTIEEMVYLPYHSTYAMLKAELERLLYLSREQKLYLSLDNIAYEVDLAAKTYRQMADITQDDSMRVSDNHKIMVWLLGEDIYRCSSLHMKNLGTGEENVIAVSEGEAIRPLGFMGEDVIYGIAREEDIVEESSGSTFFPMYAVCICNTQGELLKEYRQEGIYITGCQVSDNQISLERAIKLEEGTYQEIAGDQIMNNQDKGTGKNVIVTADIDLYERYVQIKTKGTIDKKTIKILTPMEVVFEGGRELILTKSQSSEGPRYFVYGPYGVEKSFSSPAAAVKLANELSGTVIDNGGACIWLKGNRVPRNQIMAIKEASVTEEKSSLAVCLESILQYEGISRNAGQLLAQGQSALQILEENLPDASVLDLSGCSLDVLLYYVNQDIPVLALLDNGEAVLVTGFNEFNVVLMEPAAGRLYKNGMNDSSQLFEENGNRFITYIRE